MDFFLIIFLQVEMSSCYNNLLLVAVHLLKCSQPGEFLHLGGLENWIQCCDALPTEKLAVFLSFCCHLYSLSLYLSLSFHSLPQVYLLSFQLACSFHLSHILPISPLVGKTTLHLPISPLRFT